MWMSKVGVNESMNQWMNEELNEASKQGIEASARNPCRHLASGTTRASEKYHASSTYRVTRTLVAKCAYIYIYI